MLRSAFELVRFVSLLKKCKSLSFVMLLSLKAVLFCFFSWKFSWTFIYRLTTKQTLISCFNMSKATKLQSHERFRSALIQVESQHLCLTIFHCWFNLRFLSETLDDTHTHSQWTREWFIFMRIVRSSSVSIAGERRHLNMSPSNPNCIH